MTCDEKNDVTIIGGTRGLGRWIAEDLINNNINVKITSRDKSSGEEIAKEIGASYSDNNIQAIQHSKIIIFAVPIEYMVDTIKEVAPHAPEGSLLMDVTSVKRKPAEALDKYAPENCEILPCHPMFGPRVPSLDGQVIIITPSKNRDNIYGQKIEKYLKEHNAKIVISTPEEHDKIMSVVQGLTHFSYISIASTIKKLDVNVKRSREFASPVYSLMMDMISRIVSQNPYLYYSIQESNDINIQTRRTLIDESIKLCNYIEEGKVDEFINNMKNSARHMDEFEDALGRSDKAISILTQDVNYLKDNIGNEIGVKHQYSNNIHVGTVKSVTSNNVTLIKDNNKEVKLKISNIRILTDDELYQWKKENMKLYSYDISILAPKTADENILKEIIGKIDEIVSVELIDVYTGAQIKDNQKSLTYNYKTFNRKDNIKVENYIKATGAQIR